MHDLDEDGMVIGISGTKMSLMSLKTVQEMVQHLEDNGPLNAADKKVIAKNIERLLKYQQYAEDVRSVRCEF